jgi:hypothetical protein
MSTSKRKVASREAIRRTLASRAGAVPDGRAISEATLSTWRDVSAQLAPMIGAHGVDVLFDRSVQLTRARFPWLIMEEGNAAEALARLGARVAAQEPAVAEEGSYALFVTFTELLATLIGESLTEQLLGSVWAQSFTGAERETLP